jgi:alginate O-acetyltransferase complex protein AlgJ
VADLPHENLRELEALAEMTATRVSPAVAVAATAVFLALTALGVAFELAARARWRWAPAPTAWFQTAERPADAVLPPGASPTSANRELALSLSWIEARAGRESALARALRPRAQRWLVEAAGAGNSRVVVGEEPWLFFADDLSFVAGPGFLDPATLSRRNRRWRARAGRELADPLPAFVELDRQLRARGIRLILLPVPGKPTIRPERLLPRRSDLRGAADNPSMPEFRRRVSAAGIALLDPTPGLLALAARDEVFLASDIHWTPRAVDAVASELAESVRDLLGGDGGAPVGFFREEVESERTGDLVLLLYGERPAEVVPERLHLPVVRFADGRPFDAATARGAPVLLVGDSLTNIYARVPGREGGAGLAEQLAFHLGLPVERVAADGDVSLTRFVELARRGDLDGKKAVVYEFAARKLATARWPRVTLDGGRR